jgi:hypothetical protein
MKRLSLISAVIFFLLHGAPAAHAQGFSGYYKVTQGVNPDGTTYDAQVVVEPLYGAGLYRIHTRSPGSPPYEGVAILSGETLGAGWSDGPGFGVVVYKVDGGYLQGKWLADSMGENLGKEDLEGPPGLDGIYDIVDAYSPDTGEGYFGTVEIRPDGAGYYLQWTIGPYSYTGVGLLRNNLLIAAWGTRAGVSWYEKNANGLMARWTHMGAQTTGKEDLVRLQKKKKSQ